MHTWCLLSLGFLVLSTAVGCAATPSDRRPRPTNARPPAGDADLRYWLENMVWHHNFTHEEITAATGLSDSEIAASLSKFNISPQTKPPRPADAPLLALPYPGGRHPRIGYLDGAIDPQRETKISVFAPWDGRSYVVVDVPEAIWCDSELLYLAHTHIPTMWTRRNIELDKLEWNRRPNGTLDFERRLPNGVVFGTRVTPAREAVRMESWLTNGTSKTLTGLRVQNCVMLKGAAGFTQPTEQHQVSSEPYTACRSADGKRWIITAWEPCYHTWLNPPVPCLHSDPQFPDCKPGETQRVRGFVSFYEGTDVEAEFRRLDATGWRNAAD